MKASWPRSGPTSAFDSIPTGMHGPTCMFWANLTPLSLKLLPYRTIGRVSYYEAASDRAKCTNEDNDKWSWYNCRTEVEFYGRFRRGHFCHFPPPFSFI